MPQVLTIVQDGNADMADALFYLEGCYARNEITGISTSLSMAEDNLVAYVLPEFRERLITDLKALKYAIVEGE